MQPPALRKIYHADANPDSSAAPTSVVDNDAVLLDAYSQAVIRAAETISPSVAFIEISKACLKRAARPNDVVKLEAAARVLCLPPTVSS